MSAMELRNFESQLDLLSYAEQLAVMEYLIKLMKRRQEESVSDGFEGDEQARNGLDEAIAQVERGEYSSYNSFDELLAEIGNEA
ncbi:hypothetical protein [uncultured Treponema sp.]|uniref:hypothetical protein n=1 Tax=uncultured Treponema sp. TaxID=162155 RepID=UPI0025E91F9C|nr:hypothetical protein [uncultured Treponema sp.]